MIGGSQSGQRPDSPERGVTRQELDVQTVLTEIAELRKKYAEAILSGAAAFTCSLDLAISLPVPLPIKTMAASLRATVSCAKYGSRRHPRRGHGELLR